MKLTILKDLFTIHRFAPDGEIPAAVYGSDFYSVSKSVDELSIVCNSTLLLDSDQSETGWACIRVEGPLDFGLVGILADITAALARAGISVFAVSTFDTDYILIKSEHLEAARQALRASGHEFMH